MINDLTEIELDPQQRQRIAEIASATGKHWKIVLAEAIRDYRSRSNGRNAHTSEDETALELAERLGIVGSIKDAPVDLSTNRRHFEGFGQDG